MKELKKFKFIIILLLLAGCNGWTKTWFYEEYNNNILSNEIRKIDWKQNGSEYKQYCVYSLSYFLPLNFWNVKFSNEQYVKKAIKDLNKDGFKGNNMKNIYINSEGLGTPLYSYYCIKISGEIVE